MALNKITAEEILNRIAGDCIIESCILCNENKPIPIVRTERKCDECLEAAWKEAESKKTAEADKARMIRQRIPERYQGFDLSKLETTRARFDSLCTAKAVTISGEIGTGKTNLACQILIHKRFGEYYTTREVAMQDFRAHETLDLMVIDDLTKVDASNQKRMEKFFDVLNFRYKKNMKTIFTVDRSFDELQRYFGDYGEAIVSRLREWTIGEVLKRKWR